MSNINSLPRRLQRPEIHGHRGCRGLRPENTLPAFLHAVALGVDVVELDVVISQDHQVVVSHEPWLSAKLGRDALGQLIDPAYEQQYNLYQFPYSTIQRCVVGEWPHPNFPEQQPALSFRPLLRDVLQQVNAASLNSAHPAGFSIELKSSSDGDDIFHPRPARFVDLVAAELQAAGAADRTTLLSFDPRILQAARHSYPTLKLCLLLEDYLPPVNRLFATLGFEPDVIGPDFQLLSSAMVQDIRTAYPKLQIAPWTVNTFEELETVLEWNTDAITTDYPDRLIALLSKI